MAPETLPDALAREVTELQKRGEHAAAAAALWASGFPRRAGQIFERIFEHRRALDAFEAASDMVGAVRAALALDDQVAIERLVTLAIARGLGDELLQALERAGRAAEVGRVHLARGDLVPAAAAFERAGSIDRAAYCLEDAGQAREAGVLLERHLEAHPDDVEACLRLGRVVARFGRHDDAVALLQQAVRLAERDAELEVRHRVLARAAPTWMLSFIHLGYEHAARDVLERWRAAAAALGRDVDVEPPPESLEAFAASARVVASAAIEEAPARIAGGEASLLLAGRYLLGEPLGGGVVGQVFRAYDAFADRAVAVKIFAAHALRSQAVQAYARDARAFSSLAHAAVAKLVELNMAEGFVVTELVTQPTVEHKLRAGGDGGWLVPAVKGLLDLLASCHRIGLVHGGLKPTNVFVLPAGVRVVDVGAHHLLALRSTETGGLGSVWPYQSPEQLFGAPAAARDDLYAVAAILYRALTGRAPFARAEDDRRHPPPPARTVRADVPPEWEAFLARGLAPEDAHRFVDAAEMFAAVPSLPSGHALPQALPLELPVDASLDADQPKLAALSSGGLDRYRKGDLVRRDEPGSRDVRVYEGTDVLLARPVWIVEADDLQALAPLVVWARVGRGVQPVYDVLPEARRVVVARDKQRAVADLSKLRAVPQGLTRDLAGVARALVWLHREGWCLDGFPIERALGPIGPRLAVAPAPLPVPHTPEAEAADWSSFGALVDAAFALEPDATLDARGRVLAMLHHERMLDRADLDVLGAEAQRLTEWPAFLDAVVTRLVQGASSRVVARLVASVVRG
jgi:tetratricopeptide (TPR) repeat protein